MRLSTTAHAAPLLAHAARARISHAQRRGPAPARPGPRSPGRVTAASGANVAGTTSTGGRDGASSAAVVWLKHDLRLDDNVALAAALSSRPSSLAVVYAFDPALAPAGPCAAAALAGALASLRAALRVRGSDLIVLRTPPGGAAAAVAGAAAGSGAATVHAEAEVAAAGWTAAAADAAAALAAGGASLKTHAAPLYEGGLADASFKRHTKRRGRRAAPLPAPGVLPPPPAGLAPGPLPTAADIEAATAAAAAATGRPAPPLTAFGAPPLAAAAARAAAAGGEPAARAALAAYLASGGAAGVAADPVAARGRAAGCLAAAVAQAETPATPGGSFAAIFAPSLALGTLSRRRVAADAAAALARLPPLPALTAPRASAPARAAAAAADAADFHALMAVARSATPAVGAGTLRHWRWRGVLTEYVETTPESVGAVPKPGAPALLLVHGFGAFGEQWRGVAAAAAGRGYHVYAPTIPGYGRSEKHALPYGQALWSAFVADFAASVVRRPAVAAGNSIGGYIVAAAAAAAPASFAGVALLNPAGRVDGLASAAAAGGGAPVQPATPDAAPPPRAFVEAVSRALFLYLELSIGKTLKRLYPTNPAAADAWLASEIARAAADPGALAVFQSVFYMPRPAALDVLLAREYGGPVAVLQGMLDPLNDARGRAAALTAAVPGCTLVAFDAGHCPHDEVPDEMAAALDEFAAACVARKKGGGGGDAARAGEGVAVGAAA